MYVPNQLYIISTYHPLASNCTNQVAERLEARREPLCSGCGNAGKAGATEPEKR